mmetsp:Transcript_80050/g.138946  ORF Transcript_80050/g.138946 Transcript_80050/m.138946 type:complete len:231 (-) Transcript_80050:1045-1737(-)
MLGCCLFQGRDLRLLCSDLCFQCFDLLLTTLDRILQCCLFSLTLCHTSLVSSLNRLFVRTSCRLLSLGLAQYGFQAGDRLSSLRFPTFKRSLHRCWCFLLVKLVIICGQECDRLFKRLSSINKVLHIDLEFSFSLVALRRLGRLNFLVVCQAHLGFLKTLLKALNVCRHLGDFMLKSCNLVALLLELIFILCPLPTPIVRVNAEDLTALRAAVFDLVEDVLCCILPIRPI